MTAHKIINLGNSKIDLWQNISLIVILCLIGIIIIGSIWSAFREIHIREVSKEMSSALRQMANGWERVTANTQALTQRIIDMTQLTREQRQDLLAIIRDLKELQLDIERRITSAIEQSHRDRAGTNVNFHGGARGTQIGDSNMQDER